MWLLLLLCGVVTVHRCDWPCRLWRTWSLERNWRPFPWWRPGRTAQRPTWRGRGSGARAACKRGRAYTPCRRSGTAYETGPLANTLGCVTVETPLGLSIRETLFCSKHRDTSVVVESTEIGSGGEDEREREESRRGRRNSSCIIIIIIIIIIFNQNLVPQNYIKKIWTMKETYDLDLAILDIFWSKHLLGCHCHSDNLCWFDLSCMPTWVSQHFDVGKCKQASTFFSIKMLANSGWIHLWAYTTYSF